MLLLDTNALLWLSGGDSRLGRNALARIEASITRGACAFSAVSIWEVTMLVRKGRYALGQPVETWRSDLLGAGLIEEPLDGLIAAMAGAIETLHEDPADRFIAVTAVRTRAALVTSDRRLIDWCKASGATEAIDARV